METTSNKNKGENHFFWYDSDDLSSEEDEKLGMNKEGAIEIFATGRKGTIRLDREMKKFDTCYNHGAKEVIKIAFATLVTFTRSSEPQTYRNAGSLFMVLSKEVGMIQ